MKNEKNAKSNGTNSQSGNKNGSQNGAGATGTQGSNIKQPIIAQLW